jgi:hypothetical protein
MYVMAGLVFYSFKFFFLSSYCGLMVFCLFVLDVLKEGVDVIPDTLVTACSYNKSTRQVVLQLSNGQSVSIMCHKNVIYDVFFPCVMWCNQSLWMCFVLQLSVCTSKNEYT